jgi:hypothetical protein
MKAHDEKPRNSMKFKFVLLPAKKFLVFHLRGRGYQLAVLHPFGGNEFAGDLVNFVSPASDYYYFKAIVFIQMDVQTGVYGNLGLVLHIRQKIAQPVYPVVIH